MRILILLLLPCLLAAQKPSRAQLAWHETEFYLFLHFGPNTFTDLEWGLGTETEDKFNPTALDCDQWCKVALSAGAKGLIITAKHHDGFCLWPSAFSQHTVRESKWKNGKGDVLRELSDACRRNGLKLGFYLSPWDRNHPQYGTPEYNDIYVATMTELMTQYGDLFEFWWDGANGEGPNGRRQVYDFHRFEREAARLQPNAVIFSDIGPGCRWVGNEQGTVGETNWGMLDTAGFKRGEGSPPMDTLRHGNVNGKNWIPAECDVSIRPGWFYHDAENNQVKTPDQLWSLWMQSVGRGANLILNVPPDRNGRIHPVDSANLAEFGRLKASKMNDDKVEKAYINRYDNFLFAPLKDHNPKTFVTFRSNNLDNHIYVKFPKKTPLHLIKLQEYIADGQYISAFHIEMLGENHKWYKIAEGTTVGHQRLIELPQGTVTKKLLIVVDATRNRGMAKLSGIEAY